MLKRLLTVPMTLHVVIESQADSTLVKASCSLIFLQNPVTCHRLTDLPCPCTLVADGHWSIPLNLGLGV